MCTAEREVEVSGEVDRDEKSGSERTRFHLDPNHDVGTTSPAGDAQTHHRCPTMSSRDTELAPKSRTWRTRNSHVCGPQQKRLPDLTNSRTCHVYTATIGCDLGEVEESSLVQGFSPVGWWTRHRESVRSPVPSILSLSLQ